MKSHETCIVGCLHQHVNFRSQYFCCRDEFLLHFVLYLYIVNLESSLLLSLQYFLTSLLYLYFVRFSMSFFCIYSLLLFFTSIFFIFHSFYRLSMLFHSITRSHTHFCLFSLLISCSSACMVALYHFTSSIFVI